jgi:hypothetical protein
MARTGSRKRRSGGARPAPAAKVDDLGSTLEGLVENQLALARAESRTVGLVRRARQAGATWFQIGLALGVTPQAAHKRFREVGA